MALLGITAFCCSSLEGQSTIESMSFVSESSVEIYNLDAWAHTNHFYRVVAFRSHEYSRRSFGRWSSDQVTARYSGAVNGLVPRPGNEVGRRT